LNAHDARYLVVGGYAVAVHARPRYTDVLDLFISREDDDIVRLCAAFDEFGFGPPDLTPEMFKVPDRVIQLGLVPYRVDLLTSVDGITFEPAWSRKIAGRYGEESVYFVGKEDLIMSKKAAGRPKDMEDLRVLGLSEGAE